VLTIGNNGTVDFTASAGTTGAAFDGGGILSVNGGGSLTFTLNGVSITAAHGRSGDDIARMINGHTAETGVEATYAGGQLSISSVGYGAAESVVFNTAPGSADDFASAASVDYGVNAVATATFADGNTSVLNQGSGLKLQDASGNMIVLKSTASGNEGAIGTLAVNKAEFQVGANELQTVTISIQSTVASKLGVGATYGDDDTAVGSELSSLEKLRSGSLGYFTNGVLAEGSSTEIAKAIGVIDKAIDEISTLRGTLGATQADNLQVQLDSLRVSYENLQASESTIRDTDMTSQMAQFTKYQIMMQAGTAMLAQANQQPNNILQLLR
jgi:flagellin